MESRFALSVALVALIAGCSGEGTPVEMASDALSLGARTFKVNPAGDGCKFQYRTLWVRRGGTVTFDNGTWLPADTELTSDDNVSILVEWPNALGEDGADVLEITTGTKETRAVPDLDDELFGDGQYLDFEVYCTPLSSSGPR